MNEPDDDDEDASPTALSMRQEILNIDIIAFFLLHTSSVKMGKVKTLNSFSILSHLFCLGLEFGSVEVSVLLVTFSSSSSFLP